MQPEPGHIFPFATVSKKSMDSSRRPLADTSNSSAQSPSPRRPVGSKSAAFKSTRRRQPSKSHRSTKAKKAATTKEILKEVHPSPPIVSDPVYYHPQATKCQQPKKSNICNSADSCATTQTNNLELDLDERVCNGQPSLN
jgi:hypothetical protein